MFKVGDIVYIAWDKLTGDEKRLFKKYETSGHISIEGPNIVKVLYPGGNGFAMSIVGANFPRGSGLNVNIHEVYNLPSWW